MTQLTIAADLDRCTGCLSCVVACEEEHGLWPGSSYIRLEQIGPHGDFPDLAMYYLPIACQQCRRPSCAAACAANAIGRDTRGVLTLSAEACTGCGDCVPACPYAAISMDPSGELPGLCDLCAGLSTAGHAPACVAACPAKALSLVDADACSGERATYEHAHTFALAPSQNLPSARYLLRRQAWRSSGQTGQDARRTAT